MARAMSSVYREHPPPAHLRAWVQCLWTLDSGAAALHPHRVLPDGCIDILFEAGGAGTANDEPRGGGGIDLAAPAGAGARLPDASRPDA